MPPVLLLLLLAAACCSTTPQRLALAEGGEESVVIPADPARTPWKIGYQVHSCNSLSEWPALVNKGARSLKIDPRWIGFDGGVRCAEPTGCLVLSHDPPLLRLHHGDPRYYSSLDDVLTLLSDVEPVRSVARREGMRIALCFKGAPRDVCRSNSSLSAPHERQHPARLWLHKIDAFVEAAKTMLAAQGLEDSVEFVLDGGGIPVDCLAQRWRPWRSVYMNGTAPAEAFVSDVARDGLDRFQVLNEPADLALWQGLADPAVNYGKFSGGRYPYQLWEPGSQADIQALVEVFRGGRPHAPGLDFASNSDRAMFQVYAGLGLNQELRPGEEGQLDEKQGEDVGGLVTVVRPGLAVVLLDRRWGEYRAYAFDPTQPLSSLPRQGLTELAMSLNSRLVLPGWEEGGEEWDEARRIQTFTASDDTLLVSTVGGDYFLYDVAEHRNREKDVHVQTPSLLTLRSQDSFQRAESSEPSSTATSRHRRRVRRRNLAAALAPKAERKSFSSALLAQEREEDNSDAISVSNILLLELYLDDAWQQRGCRLAYQVQRRGKGGLEDDVLGADGCLWRKEDGEAGEEDHGAAGAAAAGAGVWDVQSAVAVPVQYHGEEVVLVFASMGGKVYLTEASSVPASSAAVNASCMVQIGVGTSVAASAAAMARRPQGRGASTVVMLVSGGGFCYNSHLHNTGPFNVCRLTPHATPGVLDYTYGTATQWLQVLRGTCGNASSGDSSSSIRRRLVTACDAALLHGSYDLGHHPSVALFPTNSSDGSVGMLEVHRGFAEDCPIEPLARLSRLADDDENDEHDYGDEERGGDGESEATELGPRRLKACECGPALVRPKGSLVADSFPLLPGDE